MGRKKNQATRHIAGPGWTGWTKWTGAGEVNRVDRQEKIRLWSWGVHSWASVHSVHTVHKTRSSNSSCYSLPVQVGLPVLFSSFPVAGRGMRVKWVVLLVNRVGLRLGAQAAMAKSKSSRTEGEEWRPH